MRVFFYCIRLRQIFVLLNLFAYYYSILTAMFKVKEFGMNLLIYFYKPQIIQ